MVRHCEERSDEAIPNGYCACCLTPPADCFVAALLAMTEGAVDA